jgi:hypothetical protein
MIQIGFGREKKWISLSQLLAWWPSLGPTPLPPATAPSLSPFSLAQETATGQSRAPAPTSLPHDFFPRARTRAIFPLPRFFSPWPCPTRARREPSPERRHRPHVAPVFWAAIVSVFAVVSIAFIPSFSPYSSCAVPGPLVPFPASSGELHGRRPWSGPRGLSPATPRPGTSSPCPPLAPGVISFLNHARNHQIA